MPVWLIILKRTPECRLAGKTSTGTFTRPKLSEPDQKARNDSGFRLISWLFDGSRFFTRAMSVTRFSRVGLLRLFSGSPGANPPMSLQTDDAAFAFALFSYRFAWHRSAREFVPGIHHD